MNRANEHFVEVRELIEDLQHGLDLRLIGSPRGLDRRIRDVRVHKLGLALTGIDFPFHPDRIQILGRTEVIYLKNLDSDMRVEIAESLSKRGLCCVIITRNQRVPADFNKPFENAGVPLIRTRHDSEALISRLTQLLEERLAPRVSIHGVFIDVLGVGVLITGQGGIGKSECALELVQKGFRLVADDLVDLVRSGETIIGMSSPIIKHHMEIRGMGIINVQDLFGIASVRDRKRVEMVVEFVEFKPGAWTDALGLDEEEYALLGVKLPYVRLPVAPGKNLSVVIEVAARNHLLKLKGHHSAREFQKKLMKKLTAAEESISIPKEEVE